MGHEDRRWAAIDVSIEFLDKLIKVLYLNENQYHNLANPPLETQF